MALRARWALREAAKFVSERYGVSEEEAIRAQEEYFQKPTRMFIRLAAWEMFHGKEFDDQVGHFVHEMSEALEIKKLFGKVIPMEPTDEFYTKVYVKAHPKALESEIEYFRSIGRLDLVQKAKMRAL